MSDHRIEITFRGPAPASELERARILGSPKVIEAIDGLILELRDAGVEVEVAAASIKTSAARSAARRKPSLAAAAE